MKITYEEKPNIHEAIALEDAYNGLNRLLGDDFDNAKVYINTIASIKYKMGIRQGKADILKKVNELLTED